VLATLFEEANDVLAVFVSSAGYRLKGLCNNLSHSALEVEDFDLFKRALTLMQKQRSSP
jgi:hypothetical protein